MVSPDDRARLEAAKRASLVHGLLKCGRLLDEIAVARVRAQGDQPGLRTAHTRLLAHIDLDGTRLTEIARRAGVTKQAVAPLVDDLVGWGLLERVPDPHDGRAKLVRFTGVDGLLAGVGLLTALEAEVEAVLGVERTAELRETLGLLEDALAAGRISEMPGS